MHGTGSMRLTALTKTHRFAVARENVCSPNGSFCAHHREVSENDRIASHQGVRSWGYTRVQLTVSKLHTFAGRLYADWCFVCVWRRRPLSWRFQSFLRSVASNLMAIKAPFWSIMIPAVAGFRALFPVAILVNSSGYW